jgi:glucose-1-phosphate adenylyltransferase
MLSPQDSSRELTRQFSVQSDTLALVLAGGNGSRLGTLTDQQCKPALSFAGAYRNVDFTLSNCVNSGLRRVAVLTQYNSHSLLHHITRNWGFLSSHTGEFLELWPAQKRNNDDWYLGTANAVAQNMDLIREHTPGYTVILAGDHIYKMDYSEMLRFHQHRNAQLTVASIDVPLAQAHQFGIMGVDLRQSIKTFEEKPVAPRPKPRCRDKALASMGIYVFNTDFLLRALSIDADDDSSGHDFGGDILPWAINQPCSQVFAYPFIDYSTGESGYWRDVGTIDAYWEAQMDLLSPVPVLDLYDQEWPLMPCTSPAAPTRFNRGADGAPCLTTDSLVAGGCVMEGSHIAHSLLSTNVTVGSESIIENSVILPGANLGANCQLNRVIVDNACVVPKGTIVGVNHTLDVQRFSVSSGGIALITQDALARDEAARHTKVA